MRDSRKSEFRVGITVLIALIIFLSIAFWAKNIRFGSDYKIVKVEFNSVAGLEIGDKVTVNGVKKGSVDDISIQGNSAIVQILLDPEIKLMKDAAYSVMMLDLMGGKKIEISPGNSGEEIDYSEIQKGTFAGDVSTAMAVFGSVESDFVKLIKEVNFTLASLNSLIGDSLFASDLRRTLKSAKLSLDNMNKVILENRKGIASLISGAENFTNSANELILDNKTRIENILIKSDSLLMNANNAVVKLNGFADEITSKENNVGKLLYDKELIQNLTDAVKQANELTKIILRQLKEKGIKVDADISVF